MQRQIASAFVCVALWAAPTSLLAQPGGARQQSAAADNAADDQRGQWVTLGTRAGPVPIPGRSQPANLIRFAGRTYLVDVGDGTAGQLSRSGVQVGTLSGVFISHLHFDHTGGLAAILGLRFQTTTQQPLLIVGPPGTRALVDGLLASMAPGAAAGYGVVGAVSADPRNDVQVVELRDRDSREIGGIQVTVRNNSHYSFAADSDNARRFQSLSYRFNLPGRSIVYSGDTGPSGAVEELARGADLLIAEMMDVDQVIVMVRRTSPNMPAAREQEMQAHLRAHHLTPIDVGNMAVRAGVRAVVITHFAGYERNDPRHFGYLQAIADLYRGPVAIANDMDAY